MALVSAEIVVKVGVLLVSGVVIVVFLETCLSILSFEELCYLPPKLFLRL